MIDLMMTGAELVAVAEEVAALEVFATVCQVVLEAGAEGAEGAVLQRYQGLECVVVNRVNLVAWASLEGRTARRRAIVAVMHRPLAVHP